MKENKYKILFLITIGILTGVIITFLMIIIVNKNIDKKSTVVENKKEINSNKKGEKDKTTNENTDKIELNDTNNELKKSENESYVELETSKADSEVLNYLREKKDEISSKISDGTYKEKAKQIFIEVVDFLFYGGKIKNHTFNELTSKAKLEAIKISLQIEDKIEEYQPGLVDNISEKYTNIKTKMVNLYTSKVDEFCYEKVDLCSEVKEDYNRVKKSLKNVFNNAKNKVSDFYQNKIKNN